MNRGKKKEVCIYCGNEPGSTRDHIPPKGLFDSPRPNNLITVPCCKNCRSVQSMDDEYFITIVATSGGSQYHPAAIKIWEDKIKRSLMNSRKIGFMKGIKETLVPVELQSDSGIYYGKSVAFNYNKSRIDSVIKRIVKGMYYTLSHNRLEKEAVIKIYHWPDQSKFSSELRNLLDTEPWTVIGDYIFSFKAYIFEENESVLFYFSFYRSWPFLCLVSQKSK